MSRRVTSAAFLLLKFIRREVFVMTLKMTPQQFQKVQVLICRLCCNYDDSYEPRSVLPDAFYRFYSKLCDVTNELKESVTPETEARLVELVEYIHSTLLLPYKKTAKEIQKETEEMEDWLRRDFGL